MAPEVPAPPCGYAGCSRGPSERAGWLSIARESRDPLFLAARPHLALLSSSSSAQARSSQFQPLSVRPADLHYCPRLPTPLPLPLGVLTLREQPLPAPACNGGGGFLCVS